MNRLDELANAAEAIVQEVTRGKIATKRVKLLAERWLREVGAPLALQILLGVPTAMDTVDFCRRILDVQRARGRAP